MKKIFLFLILGVSVFFLGCSETLELDLLDDPNNPTPETADLESLYNSVQNEFEDFISAPQAFTMQLSRQRAMTAGSDYQSAFSPNSFDNIWTQAYSGFIPDADAAIARATETNQLIHVGSAKIMKAYVLMTLVDLFGDVPYTEAGQGTDIISPSAQSGESVYEAAIALVNEALADLAANEAGGPTIDLMYGGSAAGWIAAGNSLLLKAAVNMRDASSFNSIIDGGEFIADAGSDWQLQYGTSRDNPDFRHPLYVSSYEADDGQFQSNWLMWLMSEEKGMMDPRIRYYYYRPVGVVPLDNPNRFDCVFSVLPDAASTPEHYLNCNDRMPYCVGSLDNGYYGRDHGNGNGAPPDGDIRTVYGVYPAGGKFDNDSYLTPQELGTLGALGAGIHPLMPSFIIDFYRAEMALVAGDEASARDHLLNGISNSIAKVKDFGSRDQGSLDEFVRDDINGNPVFGSDFIPADTMTTIYLATVADRFDAASNKMDVVGTEFIIASYGNGIEAYNFIRRTGAPSNIQPAIQPTAGTFIRSALYPAVHVNLNQTATQKSTDDRVFWDTTGDLGTCFN